MTSSDDQEDDLLLSRGRLTESRRDEVFRKVLQTVAAAEGAGARSAPRRWLWSGLATGALALGGLILFLGRAPGPSSEFRSKGTEAMPGQLVAAVECEGAQLTSCPVGSRLLFRTARVSGFLVAFAEPAAGGERVWYFEPEQPLSLSANVHDSGYLRRTVLIGPEHASGKYRVHLVILPGAASRAAVLERTSQVLAEQVLDLVIK